MLKRGLAVVQWLSYLAYAGLTDARTKEIKTHTVYSI